MESKNKCSRCSRDSIIELRYLGESLCGRCFTKLFEKRVRRTIRLNKLLKYDDRIGITLSGGKDSAVALYIMKRLTSSIPKSEIIAITIDPGIKGYGKKSLKAAKNLCKGLDVEQYVFSFREYFGFTIDELVKKIKSMGNKAPTCSYCGILRRKLINERGRELGLNKIVTGHNLDDEVQTALMNYIRGDFNRIIRMGPFVGVLKNKGFVPRIKPLRECPEEEILRYAIIKKIEFNKDRCPYSYDAFRQTIRGIIDTIEKKYPGSRFQMLNSTDNLIEILRKNVEFKKINICAECGELTSGRLCKVCEMIKGLDLG